MNEDYANTTNWSDKFADKIAQFGGKVDFLEFKNEIKSELAEIKQLLPERN